MQQATQIQEQPKSGTASSAAPTNAAGSFFVINLCSSTSPVALSPPDHAGLKRFTFFVSRRREEGRERFRLHMGYFVSQEEAEKLLDIVREIYPGAWAGMAPGQRLRAATAAAAQAPSAAPIEQEVAPVAAAAAPVASVQAPASVPTPVVARSIEPPEEVSFELLPDDGARRRRPELAAEAAAVPEGSVTKSEEQAAARSLNDVRAAIASLEDSTVNAPVLRPPPDLKIPELKAAVVPIAKKALSKPVLEAPTPKPVSTPPAPALTPAVAAAPEKPIELIEELSDEAAMTVLEAPVAPVAGSPGKPGAAVAPSTEKAVFAVQLMWSVQPIDISQVPQLAIFSAYTLYGAEGNRDGRRWYGLRLGFFTDAVSAKQVAHYVRSEFSTVSVVPVTMRERERAKQASSRPAEHSAPTAAAVAVSAGKAASAARPTPTGTLVPSTKFEFIEDKPIAASANASAPTSAPVPRLAAGPRTGKGAPGKRAKLRTPAQAAARAKPKKLTLEETLEILGAGDLKVDDGRGELLNTDTAANAAAPKSAPSKGKASRLGRLFERLSERIGN
jgi:hypothetical protein